MKPKTSLENNIKEIILNNFVEYTKLFTPFQSEFLSGLYQRYKCLDNGTLVLYFAKKTHQSILRNKEYDLNYDLSFEKFWENHNKVETPYITILDIAKDSNLPKETTRRKLSELAQQKVLGKKNKYIHWLPSEEYKNNYNNFIAAEIKGVSKLTKYVTDKLNLNFTIDEIIEEYRKKFSFYWFHYLNLQIKWMKLWKSQFKDLEIPLLFMQIATLLSSKLEKGMNISHSTLFKTPGSIKKLSSKDSANVSVSATSISDITGIPRATCIRKLNYMANQRIISQDRINKRYFIVPEAFAKNSISKEITEKATEIFSEFYYISIKALSSKDTK